MLLVGKSPRPTRMRECKFFQGLSCLNGFLLLSQEDGGNTAAIPQDAEEPQPVKKPRGRPKGSKKMTVPAGGMVRGNGLYSFTGERSTARETSRDVSLSLKIMKVPPNSAQL